MVPIPTCRCSCSQVSTAESNTDWTNDCISKGFLRQLVIICGFHAFVYSVSLSFNSQCTILDVFPLGLVAYDSSASILMTVRRDFSLSICSDLAAST